MRAGPLGPATGSSRIEGLDGLRALAIVAVVLFHLNPSWLPGGFLGVDVFLVVSGFLITTLLEREARTTGVVDVRAFWMRRVRRLVPALFVCVVVSILVARLVNSDLLVHMGRQVLGALTFSTNWVEIAAGTSYFDGTAPQLFMNFWSLAVEEQFYLGWPLAVAALLASRSSAHLRVALTCGAALVSSLLMAARYVPDADATRVYYGTDTHLMGLMLGAALACAWASPAAWLTTEVWRRHRRPAVGAALAVLVLLMAVLGEERSATFRGGILLACLATTVLVAGLLPTGRDDRSSWRTAMAYPVLRWVGERSYGIYLWHWPVILIVGLDVPTAPGTSSFLWSRAWCVLVTLALADLSYRVVETPVRRHGFRAVGRRVARAVLSPVTRAPRIAAGSAVVAVLVVGLLVLTAPDRTETQRVLEANSAYAGGTPVTAPGGASPSLSPAPSPAPAAAPSPAPAAVPAPSGRSPVPAAPSGAAASTPATVQRADFTMPEGKDIDGIGDSMMVASVHAMDYYFPGITMDAKSNRRWSDGVAAVQAKGGSLRRAVVLALGTNAGVDDEVLGQVLDRVGPNRMVVLVTIYGRATWIDDANATLARAAAARPNVVLADWSAAIRANPGQLQSDGIHPSIKGAHLFAKTIRAALAELSERHTGRPVTLRDLPVP